MDDNEILKKIIAKAELNGFKYDENKYPIARNAEINARGLICHPDFAKAFFGEDNYFEYMDGEMNDREKIKKEDAVIINSENLSWNYCLEEWKVRLKQIVIKDNPIQYYASFL